MKILNEELNKRHDERRSDKSTFWSNWIVKIILLIIALMIIRQFTNIHLLFFGDLFRSSRGVEQVITND